ncbi:SDR family NAD(P)-dependent oxidoreductase [Vibrio sp. S4M6]|uniref:SDR family NAD(P)-dependent oxidoreductase n=1 Tax=Vibrio sinus TaxID=2946865 RepID=UPI00202A0112|nr:SDR family NAD(P)-dependent oxidoreductase [Vibrio sinus]MCL9781788.1 SDR family NAD(P)-dependent oxidoreductase [Vibrio sinus]
MTHHITTNDILALVKGGHVSPMQGMDLLHLVTSSEKSDTNTQVNSTNSDIAVIGMSGRFPGANDVDGFWENLKEGRDSVSEIPSSRWPLNQFYDPKRDKKDRSYSKWAGLLDDIRSFDADFFQVSPREAILMDPQQRLFLQESWSAIEHAGYAPDSWSGQKCGVFVGCASGDYLTHLRQQNVGEDVYSLTGNTSSILASRLSYLMNFKGPAVAVDTACSSSLVAVHMACESLRGGSCDMALAGGVMVFNTPELFVLTSRLNMLSPDGRCRTFDDAANGIVLSECVGVLALKRLSDAVRDGDNIQAVIRGSGINQDGKTPGITVPSAYAQTELFADIYSRFDIDPATIGYVEAHGTGTKLGDPIELEALTAAFRKYTDKKRFCAIGSSKTNIGHAQIAAGMPGLMKAIMCLEKKQMPPSLHMSTPNKHINFEDSPFYTLSELTSWESPQDYPRRASVTSLGFSGTNAHLVVEEYRPEPHSAVQSVTSAKNIDSVAVISARTRERLTTYAQRLIHWLSNKSVDIEFADVIHTLQVGRSQMEYRLAIVCRTFSEFSEGLTRYLESGADAESIYEGIAASKGTSIEDASAEKTPHVDEPIRRAADLARRWVLGQNINWQEYYDKRSARRVSLPGYPFASEVYWPEPEISPDSSEDTSHQLQHPILTLSHVGESGTLYGHRFTSEQVFLADHLVSGAPTLLGVSHLELAIGASALQGLFLTQESGRLSQSHVFHLKNVSWLKPVISIDEPQDVFVSFEETRRGLRYSIQGANKGTSADPLYSQGYIEQLTIDSKPQDRNLNAIISRSDVIWQAEECYRLFDSKDLIYGAGLKTLQRLYFNQSESLAHLSLPEFLRAEANAYTLHPSLMDGALQSLLGLLTDPQSDDRLYIPYALKSIYVYAPLEADCYAYARVSGNANASEFAEKRFDIDILSMDGRVLASMESLSYRPYSLRRVNHLHHFSPVWLNCEEAVTDGEMETLIIGCDEAKVDRVENKLGYKVFHALPAPQSSALEQAGKAFHFCPENESHIDELLAKLPSAQNFKLVLLLDEDTRALGFDTYAFLHLLVQRMVVKGRTQATLLIASEPATGVQRNAELALTGFARVLHKEHSGLYLRVMQGTDTYSTLGLENLVAEIRCNPRFLDDLVRYRDGKREVHRIQVEQAKSDGQTTSLFRTGGVYLITGGNGALGMQLAQELRRRYAARVVLAGRSAESDVAPRIADDSSLVGSVTYLRADVCDKEEVTHLYNQIKAQFGELNGIIHAAGVLKDAMIVNQSIADAQAVIAPKVSGAHHLDAISSQETNLDFFVLFSSISALSGTLGQAAYAYANAYLNRFAEQRESLRIKGERQGKTLAINWPYWRDGGMKIDASGLALMNRVMGVEPLTSTQGMDYLFNLDEQSPTVVCPVPGNVETIRKAIGVAEQSPDKPSVRSNNFVIDSLSAGVAACIGRILKRKADEIKPDRLFMEYGFDSVTLVELANDLNNTYEIDVTPAIFFEHQTLAALTEHLKQNYDFDWVKEESQSTSSTQNQTDKSLAVMRILTESIGEVLKKEPTSLNTTAELSGFGFNSITFVELANKLNETLDVDITPALFFEYRTIASLSEYLLTHYSDAIGATLALQNGKPAELLGKNKPSGVLTARREAESEKAMNNEPLAIIGMAGTLPGSPDLESFWSHLEQGDDLISEVPMQRWDWRKLAEKAAAASDDRPISKWGGFIDGIDLFDSLYFGISPREARFMDPAQRLMLETVYKAIGHAGYASDDLMGSKTSVYIGVGAPDYLLRLAELGVEANAYSSTGQAHSVLANRISYLLGLHGPSLAIDTACSSSLIALHRAAESIHNGGCEMAIVGGVNLMLNPFLTLSFSDAGMLSEDGRCKTFSKNANGYVRGEGVGAVLIKPLSRAEADGDNIHAVIRATAENHGGRSSSLTAPNPVAQSMLLVDAYTKANVDPSTITYIEAHGTGTSLGDPVEVNGLKTAFAQLYEQSESLQQGHSCGIGSVKTNIGHLEAAAGMAGLFKVILAMQHKTLPASLHADELNPYLKLDDSPFYVVNSKQPWVALTDQNGQQIPRRAGISSLSFAGSNAHAVLEEYVGAEEEVELNSVPQLFLLSAKTDSRLDESARRLLDYVQANRHVSLQDMAYTLQVGRDQMPARLAIIAASRNELIECLSSLLNGSHANDDRIYKVSDSSMMHDGVPERHTLHRWFSLSDWQSLAKTWIGTPDSNIDWRTMPRDGRMRRIPLPTYPFARTRHWVDAPAANRNNDMANIDKHADLVFVKETWQSVQPLPDPQPLTSHGREVILCFLTDLGQQEELRKALAKVSPALVPAFAVRQPSTEASDATPLNVYTLLQSTVRNVIREYGPIAGVMYLWPVESRQLVRRVNYFVSALQVLLKEKQPIQRMIIAGQAYQLEDHCHLDSWGALAKSASATLDACTVTSITLESDGMSQKQLADLWVREWFACTVSGVLYRQGSRYLPKMAQMPVALFPLHTQSQKLPSAAARTWLITGGGGALGLMLAEYLANQHGESINIALVGRTSPDNNTQQRIQGMIKQGSTVQFVIADVTDHSQLKAAIDVIRQQMGPIEALVHAAGVAESNSIQDVDVDEFANDLQVKSSATEILDTLTSKDPLVYVCYFSSISALIGDMGGCSYSMGNRFLNAYAQHRNSLVSQGKRNGKTIAIDWPLWEEGAMGPAGETGTAQQQALELYLSSTGQTMLQSALGFRLFEAALAADKSHLGVFVGDEKRLRKVLRLDEPSVLTDKYVETSEKVEYTNSNHDSAAIALNNKAVQSSYGEDVSLALVEKLLNICSNLSDIPESELDPDAVLSEFGFDSIGLARLSRRLEESFSIKVPPSAFFSHPTINKLARHLFERDASVFKTMVSTQSGETATSVPSQSESPLNSVIETKGKTEIGPIAIVGVSGRFPQADSVDEFWSLLVEGKHAITEVPDARWNWRDFFTAPGNTSNQIATNKGGFIKDIEAFDALFFDVSPREAQSMDPAQRLLLMECYRAIENAGLSPQSIRGSNTAVFVGMEESQYDMRHGWRGITTGGSAMIASRLSYFLDLQGPAIVTNTACSSGLVAFHQAITSLQQGECEMALVAGISLSLLADSFVTMSQAGMLSADGQCQSFSEHADGIVVGEAVVALLLTPLSIATAHKYPVRGVVKASGVNFDGKTNGVTAPNGARQAALIEQIYTQHQINVADIGHIVAHGTGTKLGDPIEINALHQAFSSMSKQQSSQSADNSQCAITSNKSNVGHTMAASGLVSVVSLLESIRHSQIPASLHCENENPHFEQTYQSLYINKTLTEWKRRTDKPLTGAVSSFGRSGTNAHVVIEEHLPSKVFDASPLPAKNRQPAAILLSASTQEQLRIKAEELRQFVQSLNTSTSDDVCTLEEIAFTLQIGRAPLAYRLGLVVESVQELERKLSAWIESKAGNAELFLGVVKRKNTRQDSLDQSSKMRIEQWLDKKSWPELVGAWVMGSNVPWAQAYGADLPKRVSLPTYPFKGETYPLLQDGFEKKPMKTSKQAPLVVIGGAGLFGICMAVSLKKAGIPFRIIEKNEDVGGVWLVNRWPGCGCDIPMLAYAYSFEHFKGDMWAKQPEILAYLQSIATKYNLYSHISFNTKIQEATWREDEKHWQIALDTGESIETKYYIHAANEGLGHSRNIPNIPGMDNFEGPLMHVLDCDAEKWDFTGKRVAVIGNGTTQIQLVETLQPLADKLVVYARSPKFIYPRAKYAPQTQKKLSGDYQFWLKQRNEYLSLADDFYWVSNDPVELNPFHPDSQLDKYFTHNLDEEWLSFYQWLRDIDMVPDYSPGCSRPCMSHDYHRQIRAQNVELKTAAITGFTKTGVATAEEVEEFDIILLATGYDLNDFRPTIPICGRKRLTLEEYYGEFPKNYAGHFVAQFPNLFLASAANSGTNATSITAIYEHSCELFVEMIQYCENNQIAAFEVKEAEVEKFRAFVQERNQTSSFSTGCSAWYQTKQGENAAIFPGTLAELNQWRAFNPIQFHFEYEPMTGLMDSKQDADARSSIALESTKNMANTLHSQFPNHGRLQEELSQFQDRKVSQHLEPNSTAMSPTSFGEQRVVEHVQKVIVEKLSSTLDIEQHRIDYDASFADFGIDSILGVELVQTINTLLQIKLVTNDLFNYSSIAKLSEYVCTTWGEHISAWLQLADEQSSLTTSSNHSQSKGEMEPQQSDDVESASLASDGNTSREPIAIVGMSGRFAESESLDAFWENLKNSKDLTRESTRWDRKDCVDPDSTLSDYCTKGSFVDSFDLFDPEFFRISPLEAMYMDPQQRLFLEECWAALEHAGYAGKEMDEKRCGVFAGCSSSDYTEFFSGNLPAQSFWGNAGSVIPARIAYYLNLRGPAMAVDTACSSSLVSIHLACQSLWSGETEMALAGGVFMMFTPLLYQASNRAGILSPDGVCRAFDSQANGTVPGEGVGVVVLKRLKDALREGDTIHGVIAGSGTNQDGRTNGITAPSGQSQQNLESSVYEKFGINPETIQLIEAHGTGTPLGDPVEFSALTQSFRRYTDKKQFCAIGSVKTNIGHATLAAGIAGVLKTLMALKEKQIPASLNFKQANPGIDFPSSPFYPATELEPWPSVKGQPRRGAVSSFGISGTNAHLVLEEGPNQQATADEAPYYLQVLSARTKDQLTQQVTNLLDFCKRSLHVSMNDMSFTLFVGRMHLEHRVAFIATDRDNLIELMENWLNKIESQVFTNRIYNGELPEGKVREQTALKNYGNQCIKDCNVASPNSTYFEHLGVVADLYTQGYELNFRDLLIGKSRRIPLPSYPFARERHWVEAIEAPQHNKVSVVPQLQSSALHPLLHRNVSTLAQARFTTTLTGEEFFLKDHIVKGQKILPAVAYLEMMREAVRQALPEECMSAAIELQGIVWSKPLMVDTPKDVSISLYPVEAAENRSQFGCDVFSFDAEEKVIHCQGNVVFIEPTDALAQNVAPSQHLSQSSSVDVDQLYAGFANAGVVYGPAHRGIVSLQTGQSDGLAQLSVPSVVATGQEAFELHPSLMDSAIQSCISLISDMSEVSAKTSLPFSLEALRILSPCSPTMRAWVKYSPNNSATSTVQKLDIDLFDKDDKVCVQIQGLSFRTFSENTASTNTDQTNHLIAVPVWESHPAPDNSFVPDEHYVLVCGENETGCAMLEAKMSGSQCRHIPAVGRDLAEQYNHCSVACFEFIQTLFMGQSKSRALVQLVVSDKLADSLTIGLSGLLKSVNLEKPSIETQLIVSDAINNTSRLASQLKENLGLSGQSVIRYQGNNRQLLRWQERTTELSNQAMHFKEDGVYLITGGLGAIGTIFAKDIVSKAPNARVVLTGRSELGARAGLELLSAGNVDYLPLDIRDEPQVANLIQHIEQNYGRLDGVLHCAGITDDKFLLHKTGPEFLDVLAPKIAGTWNLDKASRHLELDFMVLFSSQVSVIGSIGQVDYAAANGFMDQFAIYRNQMVETGKRYGRTMSINWPLWSEGGMKAEQSVQDSLRQATGLSALQTEVGLNAFQQALALKESQVWVMAGDVQKMRSTLLSEYVPSQSVIETNEKTLPTSETSNDWLQMTQDLLRKEFSSLLKLPPHRIDAKASMEQFGIDSILAVNLTNQLEKTFGPLSKTLLFEYQTLNELAEYFIASHLDKLSELLTPVEQDQVKETTPEKKPSTMGLSDTRVESASSVKLNNTAFKSPNVSRSASVIEDEPIAIVGLSGRYPQAYNLDDFWSNLSQGKDCITQVPESRWDWRDYYVENNNEIGNHRSKWGGFIDGVDEFDPLFFNISPREAEYTDPQERLFLQHAWMAVEDAGYTRAGLQTADELDLPGQVGVYAGVMYGEYQLFGAEASMRGNRMGFSGSLASIANRVSYTFNLHGPSMTLDTMCSSSLTAIHLACQDLKLKRTHMAIAGGVNVTIHPNKYLMLSAAQFISTDGRCQSFGEGGDGYIPGEGVGVVILKRLSDAQRDKDHIYGVIKGSALNHGGKTNGYTVPNPQAQAAVINRVLADSVIQPRHISYVEAHGTGTKLGDPIEIAGLSKAFGGANQDTGFCAIGSVKSNIGHGESAAGIAGLTKVLLQMKHKKLAPSLHSEVLNPNINFERTPFVVNQTLTDWDNPIVDGEAIPRIAGLSSFGAGGSNAHLIVEEYVDHSRELQAHATAESTEHVFLLSAKNPIRLRELADNLLAFTDRTPMASMRDMAYTLQVGREEMEVRLGILANSLEQLSQKLKAWLAEEADIEGLWQGQAKRNDETVALFVSDADLQTTINQWLLNKKYPQLLDLWVKGLELDWRKLYADDIPYRMSLPVYPFARDRYWTPEGEVKEPKHLLPAVQESVSEPVVVPFKAKTSWDEATYRMVWNEAPELQANSPTHAFKRALILYPEAEQVLAQDMAAQCEKTYPGASVVQVRLGQVTKKHSATQWVLDSNDSNALQRFLEENPTPDCLFFIAGDSARVMREDEKQINELAQNEIQLLRLVKTIQNHSQGSVDCFVLIQDDNLPTVNSNANRGGGLAGVGYALAQADHRFRVRVIQLSSKDLSHKLGRHRALSMILDEPASDRGAVIKYSAGRRYQQSYTKWLWKPQEGSGGLKTGGVYLIAGGSGTVGQIMTRYLIDAYQAQVVWLGRSAENDPSVLNKLNQYKTNAPWYVQADVTDQASLGKAIARVKAKYSAINGAIFSSLVFHPENSITSTTEQDFVDIIDVKISGSHNFYLALQDESLDFLCYFSSVQAFSFLSAKDSVGYAAGITAADSIAIEQGRQSRFPIGIINWGYWLQTVKGTPFEAALAARFGLIEDTVGVQFFDQFIQQLQQGGEQRLLCMPASQALHEMMGINESETSYLSSHTNPSLFAHLKEKTS